MSPLRITPFLVAVALGVGACDDVTPTSVEVAPPDDGPLDMLVPIVTDADLVHVVRVEVEDPVDSSDDPGTGPDLVQYPSMTAIFDPGTGLSFRDGFAAALGRHDYTGNVGRVETTAHVAFQDQHLGSQSAERQDFTPFLIDFGQIKNIWVQARVYTDHSCGLSVQGNSRHSAGWQFFQGTSVAAWGQTFITSQRGPIEQTACGRRESKRDPTGTERPPQGMTCTYLITYDMDTGEIVDVERLFCSTSGILI